MDYREADKTGMQINTLQPECANLVAKITNILYYNCVQYQGIEQTCQETTRWIQTLKGCFMFSPIFRCYHPRGLKRKKPNQK